MTDGAAITTTDYAGNYIYQNDVLQMISQPEGYIEPNTQGGFDYIYQYKDHLGNIRLTYKASSEFEELYNTDFNDGLVSPWTKSANTTSMTIESDRLKVVTGAHLNGVNGYYALLAGKTYEISVDVDRSLFTTDLEFSLWKGSSKLYGEYVTTSKTVTYEYTPTITDTYRINFRLRDYGYAGGDQTFYLDNVIIRNTTLALIEENNYYPFGLKHEGYNTTVTSNTNAVATKFKYNGKELNDELGLDWYDYGARFYDASLGRWHVLDPAKELYWNSSPYNYALNNPINAIDPDGNIVIFINGFTANKREQGKPAYWRSTSIVNYPTSLEQGLTFGQNYDVISHEFDTKVMDQLGDHNSMYRHGGNSINPLTRYSTGHAQGMLDAETILKKIVDDNGNPKETIKIITHSMGGAYGKGYVKALKAYIAKKGYKNVLITLVADFDPYQASALEAEDNVYTQQYTHKKKWDSMFWWLANQIQDGLSDENYHEDEGQGDHSITTFFNDIASLQEGTYTWNGSGWVLQE